MSSYPSSNLLLLPLTLSCTCPNGLYTFSVDSFASQWVAFSHAGGIMVGVELLQQELAEEELAEDELAEEMEVAPEAAKQ